MRTLERGVAPWRAPWTIYGPPTNAITRKPYKGINLWHLHLLPYAHNLYITQAQVNSVGGAIRKLEKGHTLLVQDPEGLKTETVFNVSQCAGLPDRVVHQRAFDVHPATNACSALLATLRDKVPLRPSGDTMSYSLTEDCIYLSRQSRWQCEEQYYHALFHQLIHSTGHPKRLNRPGVRSMAEHGEDPYSYEELVAEIGTAHLAALLQIAIALPQPEPSQIRGWYERCRADRKLLITAAADAQRAVDYITDGNPIAAMILCL